VKVVITALKDQSGSGQQFAYALREGGVDATMIAQVPHAAGYPIDMILPSTKDKRIAAAFKALNKADILHYKGDHMPDVAFFKIFKVLPTPRVITFGGSGFRRRDPSLPQKACLHWYPVAMYRNRSKAMSAITPDLMYAPDIMLVPHAYPNYRSTFTRSHTPTITHSPSHKEKKGTDTVFLPAIDILRKRGHRFHLRLIHNVSHHECLNMKANSHIFFDQALAPAYGMSGVEAIMRGIPMVTRMNADTRAKDPKYLDCPISFFEDPTPESAANAIEQLLLSNLQEMSERTHAWARSMHSYEEVYHRLISLYSNAITLPLYARKD